MIPAMNLFEKDLVGRATKRTGLRESDVRSVLEAVSVVMHEVAAGGTGTVRIPYLGTFTAQEKPARQGRNPQSGEPITIAAHTAGALKLPPALRKLPVNVD